MIGEHTDYNGGFVLPLAIGLGISIAARPHNPEDSLARLWSTQFSDECITFELSPELEKAPQHWSNYLRGVLVGCLEAGLHIPGFDALIHADLPPGGGLSSSAALEAATATLAEALSGQLLDPLKKALLCQKAEHTFAGMPCGIMDQFAVIFGEAQHVLLIDCQSLHHESVPWASSETSLLVINTMVKHELTDGGYASRRRDCEAAARLLGARELREVSVEQLESAREQMPELLHMRAHHVIAENERTLAAAEALRRGAWSELGELMYASHASLRDDFEVSCYELDLVVEMARQIGEAGGVYGCRMTGGGFGGCCVAVVKSDQVTAVSENIHRAYRQATGIEPILFSTQPAAGARMLPSDPGAPSK